MTARLTDAEQRANRIALWRRELLDLIPDGIDAELADPDLLLDSLVADVTAAARAEVVRDVEAALDYSEMPTWMAREIRDALAKHASPEA